MGQHPLIGKPAPALTLPSIPNGEPYSLPIGQKPIALFFFPAAGTLGCTMEVCAFRDATIGNTTFKRHPELEVVGISGDATAKLSTFADEHKVPYLFLSDNDRKARQAYQVEKNFLGLSEGRITFFIDSKGVIRDICDSTIITTAHAKFVEKMLKQVEKGQA